MNPEELFTRVCSSRIPWEQNGLLLDILSHKSRRSNHSSRNCFAATDRADYRCRLSHL